MAVEVNEDGFSTFRTGKHIDQMTMEEVDQIDKHIQSKISNLLSMSDFDPENKNHQLQINELKADRDRIRERKSSFSGEVVTTPEVESTPKNSNPAPEVESQSQASRESGQSLEEIRQEARQSVDQLRKEAFGETMDEFSKMMEEHRKGRTDSSAPVEEEKISTAQETLPAVVEEPPVTQQSDVPPNEPPKAPNQGSLDNLPDSSGPGPGGPNNPKPTPEAAAKKAKLVSGRGMVGGAFVGYDIYSRMKEGEGAVMATAKALGTNALFAALPGGIIGGITLTAGVTAASMATELYDDAEEMKGKISRKNSMFDTSFEENEGQIANRKQGMEQQRQAEQYALDRMRRHAQGAHSSY